MLGPLIALFAAFSFSMNAVLVRRGMAQASASQGAFVTVLIGVPLFLLAALASGQLLRLGDLAASSYGLLAASGLIHFVAGRYFNYRAIGAIGATRTAPIQALTIPYSVLIALLFLGENISAGMGAGIVLIMIGPAIMVERPARRPVTVGPPGPAVAGGPPEFQMRQLEGYVFAILGSLAYGTSPILIRAALEGESGLAVLGGLVAYAAAAAFLLAGLALPGRGDLLAAMRLSTIRIFLGAGFFVFLAQMLRFIALSLAPVAVVTTLQRTGSIFTLGLSWLMNRHLENITPRVVLGIAISVTGAVVLVAARGS